MPRLSGFWERRHEHLRRLRAGQAVAKLRRAKMEALIKEHSPKTKLYLMITRDLRDVLAVAARENPTLQAQIQEAANGPKA